ncbi:MAG: protein YgfX [Bacillota bacterium]
MSIAVSAIVRPSRILFAMVGAMCAIVAAIGIAIVFDTIGSLTLLSRTLFGATIIFLSVFGFYHGVRYRKILHIDISSAGQFRLAEVDSASPCAAKNWPHVGSHEAVVALLKDSTIWPFMLLLRLQAESGKITTVPILPDSVSRDSFRALSVACRWVAARSEFQE